MCCIYKVANFKFMMLFQLLFVPLIRAAQSNHAACQSPSCVAMQQAPSIPPSAQVILLLVNNDGPAQNRQPPKQRGPGIHQATDFPVPSDEIPKVSRVIRVVGSKRVVVPTSGGAALAQVSVLVDVDGSGLRVRRWQAVEFEADAQLSLRPGLFKQNLSVYFRRA